MKFSIITVAFNASETIAATLDSISRQKEVDVEIIVIDGGSTDGTIEIVKSYGNAVTYFISEKDDGIYDAMNKGAALASGDIVAFLNADDFYTNDDVLKLVQFAFASDNATVVAGAVEQIDKNHKIVRKIRATNYSTRGFLWGIMLPHPTTFVSLPLFRKVGKFVTQYKIAGDFDFFIRLINHPEFRLSVLGQTLVKMRIGGVSTAGLGTYKLISSEMKQALKKNGFRHFHWRIDLRGIRKFTELRFKRRDN